MALFSRLFKFGERGQIIVITALLLPVLAGMTGLALDIGTYSMERRNLQNDADSIALAAAQELPNSGNATAKANEWAANNDVSLSQLTVSIEGGTTAPLVRATITKNHKFAFLGIFGISDKDVSAKAAAVKVSFGGAAGIVPWTVTQATLDASTSGDLMVMKYDALNVDSGNFGAIRIDGPGSNTYNSSVLYGSTTVACAATAPNCTTGACPGQYPAVCSETSPECDGPECQPETGNMVGPTRTGVDFRIAYTSTTCDEFTEAFTPSVGDSYDLNPDCNPWLDGPGKCLTNTSLCSRRVIIIPVVDEFGSGASDPSTLQRFALVFLEGYDTDKCQGNACEIKGRFVTAEISAKALAGAFDEDAPIHFVRLSE